MSKALKGLSDTNIEALKRALDEFEAAYPGSDAALYRQNPGSIRVRIIADHFAGMTRSRRHDEVWQFLSKRLDEDVMGEISTLVLIPTAELRSSLANLDFEESVSTHS